MTEFYLILAVFLAFALNHYSRVLRVLGTLTAALGLIMIAWSIILANLDGTFAAIPADSSLADRIKPYVLNIQAAIATATALFLLWAVWVQSRRRVSEPMPMRNTTTAFGLVSRYAHWVIGTLILILLPMGLFVSTLAPGHPERPAYMATHQSLGLMVLLLVVLRMVWLSQSPAPVMRSDLRAWQRQLAKATHVSLYVLILAFPVTGILLTVWRGDALDLFGWSVQGLIAPNEQLSAVVAFLHNLVLPALFYFAIFMHLGAVTKHHFIDHRQLDVRRMLR